MSAGISETAPTRKDSPPFDEISKRAFSVEAPAVKDKGKVR